MITYIDRLYDCHIEILTNVYDGYIIIYDL